MNIIFDLDGTLIDSSDGILKAVKMAFNECNITLQHPLTSNLIGPPLNELLVHLAGTKDSEVLQSLASAFKASYDTQGYKETLVFCGIKLMLKQLKEDSHSLYIATNKRLIPTQKIISYFGWNDYFEQVYALDMYSDTSNKSQLLQRIIELQRMDKQSTVYIGDMKTDKQAADENNLKYFMAMWGYNSEQETQCDNVDSPELIVSKLSCSAV